MQSQVRQLYERLSQELNNDPRKQRKLTTQITSTVSGISSKAMSSDESYCFRFNLPMNFQRKVFEIIDSINQDDLYNAFYADWGRKAMQNRMHSDPYYQILLLLFYYSVKENIKVLKENTLMLILFKLWNGRKTKFLKWCDPDIMQYVVSYMTSRRHAINKYDDPYDLIKNYFVPTLLKKYESKIEYDPFYLKTIFEQAYVRIRQIFVQDNYTNIRTGKKESRGGILALYMKAKEQGLSMKNPSVRTSSEEGPSFQQYTTGSNQEEMTNTITNYITMNPRPNYSQSFIKSIRSEIPVSVNLIEKMLVKMHDHSFHDSLHEIINIILSQTDVSTRSEICSPEFMDKVKKKVIASKNNKLAKTRSKLTMNILDQIFQSLNLDIRNYSTVNQIQIRKIITYGLVHNMQKAICQNL